MDDVKKHLGLSKNLNKLLYEEIDKNGKNNLNKLLNNGFFSKKLLTEAYTPAENLLVKYRDFYYKNVAKKIFEEYKIGFFNVKFYNNVNILKNPNYNFILFYQTGSTGDYATISKLEIFKLPIKKYYKYEFNPSTQKWTYNPVTSSATIINDDHYTNSINVLVSSATTREVNFGAEKFKMYDKLSSTDWSKSFPASEIFKDFDAYSEGLLRAEDQVITKIT